MVELKEKLAAEKNVSVHKTGITVVAISVKESKEVVPKSRKSKWGLENLWAGVNHHNIHHTTETKFDDGGETSLQGRVRTQKIIRKISKLIQDLFSCPTHFCGIIAPKKLFDKEKSKKNSILHVWWLSCTLRCDQPIKKLKSQTWENEAVVACTCFIKLQI